jgi:hypothetical protein
MRRLIAIYLIILRDVFAVNFRDIIREFHGVLLLCFLERLTVN